ALGSSHVPGVPSVAGGGVGALHRAVLDPLHAPTRYQRDFEEVGVLGSGGFGTVMAARHRIDGQLYAVKRIRIKPVGMDEYRARAVAQRLQRLVLSEARSVARISHPNVVRYFSSWLEVRWVTPDCLPEDDGSGARAGSTGNLVSQYSMSREATESGIPPALDLYDDMPSVVRGRSVGGSSEREEGEEGGEEAKEELEDLERALGEEEEEAELEDLERALVGEARGQQLEADIEVFIQMEHCGFVTLQDVLERYRLSRQCALGIAVQVLRGLEEVLRGLEEVQQAGLMHRDVKPANVFLTPTKDSAGACMRVKLGDFGLATGGDRESLDFLCARTPEAGPPAIQSGHHLQSGQSPEVDFSFPGPAAGAFLPEAGPSGPEPESPSKRKSAVLHTIGAGTPSYMAPEQSNGRRYDARADVYATGVLLLQMVAAFETSDARASALHLIDQMGRSCDPQDVALPPRVAEHPGVASLVRAMLARDPAKRPSAAAAAARAAALRHQLLASAAGKGQQGSTSTAGGAAWASWRKKC
ncbi:kinase-like domain-containing protein, partial [Baffinella frigidus]